MTYNEFKNKYNGKYTDFDGAYGYQCWDLAQRYITEVLGLPRSILDGCGLVSNMLKQPKRAILDQYFDQVPLTNMAQGDIIIWSWGHIAVYDSWDGHNNWYFSQNPNPCQVMRVRQDGQYAFRKKQPKPKGEVVDQILHKGSKVQLEGTYEVKDINAKENMALITIQGKDYWISATPLKEV